MKKRRNNKEVLPSRTGRTGSQRACLCWDENTYSRSCCDGSITAQGIGNITRTN